MELLRRTGGNLRVVQEHLRHADIQTTTPYTRLMPQELQQVVSVFDGNGNGKWFESPPRGTQIPSAADRQIKRLQHRD